MHRNYEPDIDIDEGSQAQTDEEMVNPQSEQHEQGLEAGEVAQKGALRFAVFIVVHFLPRCFQPNRKTKRTKTSIKKVHTLRVRAVVMICDLQVTAKWKQRL